MTEHRATWLADVLRAAGLKVVELPGWKTRGAVFTKPLRAVVLHHDGSPPGASPNVPAYMAGQIDKGKAGAQCWVGLDGTWHLVAAGRVSHAGRVLHGKPGNPDSIGVETDHTTGEPWSGVVMLDSIRRGEAAILRKIGYAPHPGLEFHKTICSPVGRKTDPDGLDLTTERREVALLFLPPEEDDMFRPEDSDALQEALRLLRGMNPMLVDDPQRGHQSNLTKAVLAARAAATRAGQQVDVPALASSIADDLGDDIARQVAEELTRRLSA